jgi:hypothetical protein
MSRRLLIIASALVFSISAASAQAPSPDAMTAARSLVTTMKLPEQYKALLPGILLGLRRELTQAPLQQARTCRSGPRSDGTV